LRLSLYKTKFVSCCQCTDILQHGSKADSCSLLHKLRTRKRKFVPLCASREHSASTGTVALIFNLGVSGQFHTPAALPPRNNPSTSIIGRWAGLRAGHDVLEKIKICFAPAGIQTPERPSRSFVTVPTTLSRVLKSHRYLFSFANNSGH
jgi:hypothetical protein